MAESGVLGKGGVVGAEQTEYINSPVKVWHQFSHQRG